jgi:hypothetical protein
MLEACLENRLETGIRPKLLRGVGNVLKRAILQVAKGREPDRRPAQRVLE